MKEFFRRAVQDEESRAYIICNDIVAVVILASVTVFIFESVQTYYSGHAAFFGWAEVFFVSFFTIEYVIRVSFAKSRIRYMTSFFGIIDLLSFLPSYLLLFTPLSSNVRYVRMFRVLRVFRLLRLFRIVRLISHMKKNSVTREMMSRLPWVNIQIYFFALFSLIVISGTLVFIAEQSSPGTPFINIPMGMWWALVTATTVGYGDMVPATVAGKIIAAFTMLAGLSLFALLVTVMGKTMQVAIFGSPLEEEEYREFLEERRKKREHAPPSPPGPSVQ